MQISSATRTGGGPRRRRRHYSYDESVNEPAKLIDDEPVEIEHELPAEENLSEQAVEPNGTPPSPED